MENQNKYKTGLKRFFAAWADGFIMGLLTIWFESQLFSPSGENQILFFSIIVATPILYSILMHGFLGWTLGKKLLRIKVVRNSDEKSINMLQATLRDIVPLLLVMFCIYSCASIYTAGDTSTFVRYESLFNMINYMYGLWLLLEIITMLFNKKRRAFHDFMANTVVIDTNLRKPAEEIEVTASMRPQMPKN